MSNKFANRVLVGTTTTGTGTVTLGAALAGYQTFAAGGIANADTVRYLILDGLAWEIGIGTYTASGTTLSRDTVEQSSLPANAKLTLSGGASVAVIASQADYSAMTKGPATSVTDNRPALFDGTTGRLLKQHTATLGTAAAANITTSATDTTAGRLWANSVNGMFGLGASTTNFGVTADATGLADIPVTSFFVHSGAGKPGDAPIAGSNQGAGVKIGGGADWNAVIWAGLQVNRWFGRVAPSSGDAGPWCEFVHNLNLLGTVSQSDGIPTGAVIQRGSNANGAFVRFADGTLICTHRIDLGSRITAGAGTLADPFRTNTVTWTFPSAFIAFPALTGTGSINSGTAEARQNSLSFGSSNAERATSIQAGMLSSDATNVSVIANLQAIGRWF
jgi:hypothetical protein